MAKNISKKVANIGNGAVKDVDPSDVWEAGKLIWKIWKDLTKK